MFRNVLMVVSTLAFISGCSKLTRENYQKLEPGMSQQQVENVLGEAQACSKMVGALNCRWGEEDGTFIKVVFMADKAVAFSFENL
ncbi:outer membrane protein assembly factor BamE domain-containing protein [Alteromonas lipotrueiana]|uniref:outer membrane protein assembly factor BamE domain-containing protein n=1 Tax=Alteromonas lipotrueiana TaxID=2803815 RepID=UPI001C45290E|nr:outer membrane protein assembly factor BamE [Alteromonas lipotrueiana]